MCLLRFCEISWSLVNLNFVETCNVLAEILTGSWCIFLRQEVREKHRAFVAAPHVFATAAASEIYTTEYMYVVWTRICNCIL